MTDSKSVLRKKQRAERASIDLPRRHAAALAATQRFVASPYFTESQHIACYLASSDEFDTAPIIQAIWQANKHCYLPILSPESDPSLYFAHYDEHTVLRQNRYRILEPSVPVSEAFPADQLDVVLIPLIAFDLQGYRLGSGGGYYDRTFAFMLSQSVMKPLLLGLGYAQQQVPVLAHDPWDVPLTGVVTEQKIILF